MKITALCMVLAGVHLSVWAFSQKTISLAVNKEPLSNVLSLIEQKSGYRFLYQYKEMYETKTVSLKVDEAPLEYVLSLVLKGTGLDYSINGNNLIDDFDFEILFRQTAERHGKLTGYANSHDKYRLLQRRAGQMLGSTAGLSGLSKCCLAPCLFVSDTLRDTR